ncbi:MAG: putative enoyl-CoA hydratase echA8 [Acidimicrobiales bacterium]|nr:MAG: enoyl-CoA hydratase [Actinomycetota bacterium]MBV6509649.1 putative enoyl-CoA hydratase echA8 [Acidimicrobiales bacterium]RIK06341.1 MAG: enoyl-CoA hydratase [Acidobacteriota bacterium]
MSYECITVDRREQFAAVTMNLPDKRNALGLMHLTELADAFRSIGGSDALGVVLAGNGPVFSAGHDFSEMAGSDLVFMQRLLGACVELMDVIQSVPQVVIARVHGLATAAGCQLVATCDLAVAAESAGFAVPGGKGGWFCTTPMVALGRNIGRKRAFEMALTGDTIDASTAADWGLVNRVVPDPELDAATSELLGRATRGSPLSKAIGKKALYHQLGLSQDDAYSYATEVMSAASQTADAQEGMAAFVEKRPPRWTGH